MYSFNLWILYTVIFTKAGKQPNIVPEETELVCLIRTPNNREHAELRSKVNKCFEGAAEATGCRVSNEITLAHTHTHTRAHIYHIAGIHHQNHSDGRFDGICQYNVSICVWEAKPDVDERVLGVWYVCTDCSGWRFSQCYHLLRLLGCSSTTGYIDTTLYI